VADAPPLDRFERLVPDLDALCAKHESVNRQRMVKALRDRMAELERLRRLQAILHEVVGLSEVVDRNVYYVRGVAYREFARIHRLLRVMSRQDGNMQRAIEPLTELFKRKGERRKRK
jgi:DNA-binding transcriptional regulator YbjK